MFGFTNLLQSLLLAFSSSGSPTFLKGGKEWGGTTAHHAKFSANSSPEIPSSFDIEH